MYKELPKLCFMKISWKTENISTDMICIILSPSSCVPSAPNAFQQLWIFSVQPLLYFWQSIIVLSWQQGIVMELSSCTHKQMQNWLTLHNAPWIVLSLSLFGNADENGTSVIREQTYCRILHALEIVSSSKWRNTFICAPYHTLHFCPRQMLSNLIFNTFSRPDNVCWHSTRNDFPRSSNESLWNK